MLTTILLSLDPPVCDLFVSSTPPADSTEDYGVLLPVSRANYGIRPVRLNELLKKGKVFGKVGFCGVVRYFRPLVQNKEKKYPSITMGLMDPSCPSQTLHCTIVHAVEHTLPTTIPVSSIVLLKGLKVNASFHEAHAIGDNTTILGVFSNSVSGPPPRSIRDQYQLVNNEIRTVLELREWCAKNCGILSYPTLKQLKPGDCNNVTCFIGASHPCPGSDCVVLEVFDGTTASFTCQDCDCNPSDKNTTRDNALCVRYGDFLHPVYLMDSDASEVAQPGQCVVLNNLHASQLSTDSNAARDCKLIVSSTNGGRLTPLNDSLSKVFMDFIPMPRGPFPRILPSQPPPTAELFTVNNKAPKQTVQAVLESTVGSVHVVEGQIMSIANGPVQELCQLRCSMCRTNYLDRKHISEDERCVFCTKGEQRPLLQYTYAFSMRFEDATESMDICVTAKEGTKFLQFVAPTNFYVDSYSARKLLRLLYVITGWNDPFYPVSTGIDCPRPTVQCAVKVFRNIQGQKMFRLVDTVCNIER